MAQTESDNATGPYEDLPTTVRRRKLKWYGFSHDHKDWLRHSLNRKKVRQAEEEVEDNNSERSLKLSDSLRESESRERWRKLVARPAWGALKRRQDR